MALSRVNCNRSLVGKLYLNRLHFPLQKTVQIIIHLGRSTTSNDVNYLPHLHMYPAAIFIDMFAPKWARGPHNLARFPSWDPCITPGYWAWYLSDGPDKKKRTKTQWTRRNAKSC